MDAGRDRCGREEGRRADLPRRLEVRRARSRNRCDRERNGEHDEQGTKRAEVPSGRAAESSNHRSVVLYVPVRSGCVCIGTRHLYRMDRPIGITSSAILRAATSKRCHLAAAQVVRPTPNPPGSPNEATSFRCRRDRGRRRESLVQAQRLQPRPRDARALLNEERAHTGRLTRSRTPLLVLIWWPKAEMTARCRDISGAI